MICRKCGSPTRTIPSFVEESAKLNLNVDAYLRGFEDTYDSQSDTVICPACLIVLHESLNDVV